MQQTVDALWICIFRPHSARERWVWAYSIFCVRLCIVCSFNSDGQYQSLYAWDEQTVRLSRFFFINQSIANEEGPAARSKMCSIEYLFRECNMHHHALGIELHAPVLLCGKPTTDIVLLKVNCSDKESEQLTRNVLEGVNTNVGIYSITVSDETGNPHNPQHILLDIANVKEIWRI